MIRNIVFYAVLFLAALFAAIIIAQMAYGQCSDAVMSDRLSAHDVMPYMRTLGIDEILGVHNNPSEQTATVYFKRIESSYGYKFVMALRLVRFENGYWYDPQGEGNYICRSYR